MTYRFHILGIPHTASNSEHIACAYTQKVVKLCRMLTERGHMVLHYGNELSRVSCAEHVTVTTADDLIACYGAERSWRTNTYRFGNADACYLTFHRNAIAEIGKRKQPRDFLLCMFGTGHQPVAAAHPDLITVEPGIGYANGTFARFRVYESYALMHAHLGLDGVEHPQRADWYSVVIPNYFDPEDFRFSAEKDDYLLFLGRYGIGKGAHIAIDLAQRLGFRLQLAGQDQPNREMRRSFGRNVHFVGFADQAKRKRLLSRARALLALSTYVEPFGGVQIEAMLSGTPIITSDWGAFTEVNLHGITGYRCRTFEQMRWAIEHGIARIDPAACRDWAARNYSMERVGEMYDEFFWSLMNLYSEAGWYTPNAARRDLHWLERAYPSTPRSLGTA